jgi:hypothetical protein
LLLLISFDLCVLTSIVVQAWREHLAGALGLPLDAILLSSTHTHSGPYPRVEGMEDEICQLATHTPEADTRYAGRVIASALEAAREAVAGLKPHTLFWNEAPLGFAYNRRVRTGDGIKMCWNPREFPHLKPSASPDPQCGALVFRDGSGREIVLWSANAHPVVLGKGSNVVSADWPGYACGLLEKLHPWRRAIFVLGACGEVHPWVATQSEPAAVVAVGRTAANFVDLLCRGTQTPRTPQLKAASRNHEGMQLSAWNIGGVILAGAPVELFASLSAQLRKALDRPLLIATLANGWHAYFPDKTAFSQGAYEVEVALSCGRKPGDGEALMGELESLVHSVASDGSPRESGW